MRPASPFHDLLNTLSSDTLEVSLPLFQPELIFCGTIVLMLLVRVFHWGQRVDVFYLALAGSAAALWCAIPDGGFAALAAENSVIKSQEIFTGLLVYDSLTIYLRTLLSFFAVLFIILTKITGLADHDNGPDFYSLVLGATLGMCIMGSANHLLAVFLGVEMASVPSYVLAGILRGRPRSSEAALKYAVYGAGAAGVMLYGISLLCGVLGSAHLPTMAMQLADLDVSNNHSMTMVLALGGLMVMVGLAFKLSAVPFHFWCPDVFEGAAAEIGAFLSVASKAAALALLIRVTLGLGFIGEQNSVTHVAEQPAAAQVASAGVFSVADNQQPPVRTVADSSLDSLTPVRYYMVMLLGIIAAVTCTFGNLAAYGQTNIKRMLAYSTIAHAGYMMMPVAAALALCGSDAAGAQKAIASLTFYIALYLFMNLGAFAIVAFLRSAVGSEEIADYGGLVQSCPMTVVAFATILFSLVGLPPLAGFAGKIWIFYSLIVAGGPLMITLLVVAGLNTAISLVYYLRVVKVMTIDPVPDTQGPVVMRFIPATYAIAVALPVLILGVWFEDAYQWAAAATVHLFS